MRPGSGIAQRLASVPEPIFVEWAPLQVMFPTDLNRVSHQFSQRFNVRWFSRPVALKCSLGVGVPTGIHTGIFVQMNSVSGKSGFQRTESGREIPSLPRRIDTVAEDGLASWNRSNLLSDDLQDFRIGDVDCAFLAILDLAGLKGPLHSVSVIVDVLRCDAGELGTESCSCANADLDGDGQGWIGILVAGFFLLGRNVGDSAIGRGNLVSANWVVRDQVAFHTVVESTFDGLDSGTLATVPVVVSGNPVIYVERGQLRDDLLTVAWMDTFSLQLCLLLATGKPFGARTILITKLRWKPEAEVEQGVSPIKVGLGSPVLLGVLQIDHTNIEDRAFILDLGFLLLIQQESGVGFLEIPPSGFLVLDVVAIFVSQGGPCHALERHAIHVLCERNSLCS